jgi:DNA (cytosine-5)-methyltransferase 1
VPTLNGFDNGDVRSTTVIVVRMREGKPGGGKGPLMSEDKSLTLATANDQTLFVFHPHRSDGVRLQGETINTLTAFMGTGGNNMPMVAYPISGNVIGRQDHNGPNGKSFGEKEDPMFTITSTDRHAIAFSHTQGLDAQPSEEASPTLRANGGGMAVAYDEFNDSVAETHHTLRAGTKQSTGVVMESVVRRLTPTECERLQGFPDGWTEGQSDTNRYKQMGNAVAVPVVEWLIAGITQD